MLIITHTDFLFNISITGSILLIHRQCMECSLPRIHAIGPFDEVGVEDVGFDGEAGELVRTAAEVVEGPTRSKILPSGKDWYRW